MTKIITIPYKPHPLQKLLHDNTSRFKTIVCGRRFGKTTYIANKLIKSALVSPNNYGYIAPTYSQAEDIIWELLKEYIPPLLILKINQQKLRITFKTGGKIRLYGADNPSTARRIRGLKFNGLGVDEFADFKNGVEFWETTLRPTLIDTGGWCDFLGTPRGKIGAFYEMFIKDKNYYDENYLNSKGERIIIDNDFKSFIFKTLDNPYIPKEEVEKARLTSSPQYFRQEYEASFENYTGLIYKEFDINRHIIKREDLKLEKWWNIYVGIDTGRFTAISFLAMDDKGVAYLFDEIYDYDGIVANICQMIFHKLLQNGIDKDKVLFFIDSASQVKAEYKFNKITCFDAKKDVENQIALVRNRFSHNNLLFCDNCKMHTIEHQAYMWDDRAQKVKPKDENDHTCNSLQYIFSTYTTYASKDIEKEKKYMTTLEYYTHRREITQNERW
jgi:hypothetical protein